jgi:hypothetical protein
LAAARLEHALGLWRGAALPDLGDGPTVQAAAARLQEHRLGAEEDLADARLALGGGPELVADLDAAARSEPLRERRWGQLMQALYRSGRQGDALRAYQRARTALVEGLGIEPGRELRAIERAVIAGDPALLAAGRDTRPAEPQPLAPLPPGLASITATPIAGRSRELDAIAACWAEVRGGGRRAVVVLGEPGIGKTRLIAEGACRAHGDGALVLFGRCDRDALTPYQAVVDALRTCVRTSPRATLAATATWQVRELARIVPELGEWLGVDPGPIADEPAARHRLFDSVAGFLGPRGAERPVVLVIDDLQWIDRGGAALLRHLLRATPGRLLLLASHRSSDGASGAALAEHLAQMPAEVAAIVVPVGGLDVTAVHELTGGTAEDAAAIHEASGGSPLFVVELARFRAATGRLPDGDEVPSGVRQAVGRRVAGLSPAARRLVEVAAVAAAAASTTELAAAGGTGEREAIDLIDQAIAAHVLCEETDAAGVVTFTHDLVRAAILGGLSATRRAYLHRRVARTILDHTHDEPGPRAAEVAHHLAAGAEGPADPEVVRWAIAAARQARAKLAWETAAAQLELALVHLRTEATAPRCDLLVDLATASRAAGRESDAKRHFTEAVALARTAGDAVRAGSTVLAWAALPLDVRWELDEVIAALRDALGELSTADDPLRAQLMARLAFSLAWTRDPGARAIADAAVAMARRTRDPIALARALLFSTSSRHQFDAYDPAGSAGELNRLLPAIGDPVLAAQALECWITGCIQRDDRVAVDHALEDLRALVDRYRLVEAGFRLAVVEAHLALADGHIDRADRAAGELLARAARTDLRNLFLFAGSLMFDVRRAQGRLAELLGWFEQATASGEAIPRVPAMRAHALAAAGRLEDAAGALVALAADDLAAIVPAERPHSIATLADVAVQLHDAEAAAVLRRELEPWSGLVVYDGVNGPLEPVDRYLARLDETLAEMPPS